MTLELGLKPRLTSSLLSTVKAMFSAGDVGFIYDTQNLASMFQDVAGTIPANQPGHPVGLRLDLSGRGNHATQPVAASRPTLARRPASGVRNLLTNTDDLSNAAWFKTNTVIVGNKVGGAGEAMSKVAWTATAGAQHSINRAGAAITAKVGLVYTMTVDVEPAEMTTVHLHLQGTDIAYPLVNLTTGTLISGGNNKTTIQKIGAICRITMICTATGTSVYPLIWPGSIATTAGDGVSGVWVGRPQVELSSSATPYQRVGSIYDVTEAGQPDRWCLVTDGVDDGMVTPTMNLSGKDKTQIVVGLKKLSDAAQGCVFELGLNGGPPGVNAETALLLAPGSAAAATYWWRGSGTLTGSPAIASGFPSPNMAVVSGQIDVGSDVQRLRVNGATEVLGTGDLGTDGSGTGQIAYLYRRGGTSLPAKIEDYGMICRVSTTNLTPAQIGQLEAWMNQRTGAY